MTKWTRIPRQELNILRFLQDEGDLTRVIATNFVSHCQTQGYPLEEDTETMHFLRNCLWMREKYESSYGFAFCQRAALLCVLERIVAGDEELEVIFWEILYRLQLRRGKKLSWGQYELFADYLQGEPLVR